MNTLETLLSRRWILKSRDKDLYYQLRDQLGTVKRFLTEKMGYQVLVNPYLIKVEKLPAESKVWMGIQEFNDPLQYVFLCMILMFLEEKEVEEQFVLSSLTEYIQAQYRERQIDWTSYTYRRHLVKVMKFCVSSGMITVDDGSEESFMHDAEGEVLYENTGVSRYFMRNFTRNIMEYQKPEDFAEDEWIDVDTDRGIVRRQRVYRKLLMNMGMYRNGEEDEDFAYVKNYRNMISGELEELLDCELQVHRGSAYLIMGEGGDLGRNFPEEKTLSDMVLLWNQLVLQKIRDGQWDITAEERLFLSEAAFRGTVEELKRRYGQGFIKTYREMTMNDFYQELAEYMERLDLIEFVEDGVCIYPVLGKIVGAYPEDFGEKEGTENE